jgi:outer membrane receptor protein involved in Fe transport
MIPNRSAPLPLRWLLLAPVCALLASPQLRAQRTAPDAATLAKYDKNKNGRLDADELAALQADEAKAAATPTEKSAPTEPGDALLMSPFEVKSGEDTGYLASSTMSGTRLNSKLEDLGASITVVTKQQLLDTASVDLNDIFMYEANTEGTGQFTNSSVDVNGLTTDSVQNSPQTSNRIRGIGQANMSIGGFESNSRIPVDTYNLDSVEIARGANSNLFGLGNASGTVNLNQSQGNLNREITQFSLRGDNWGGFRGTVDLNRPIFKNKLAIRLSGLYDSKGFVRKPSGDLQRRQYIAVTYVPFESTKISGSAEFMTDQRQTPNAQTPRDTISYWMQNGRPTWDPITQTANFRADPSRLTDPVLRSVLVGTNDALLPSGLGLDTTQYTRPSFYVDGGKIQLWTPNRNSNNGIPNNTGGAARIIGTYTDVIRNRAAQFPLYTPLSVSDKSLYDWTDVNFAATNWNEDKAATYNFTIDQKIFRTESQQLYAQGSWRHEYSATYNRNLIGSTSFLYLDINERLLDGKPNPYFLRPYVTVWEPTVNRTSDNVDFLRAQLAYLVDFRRKGRWISWLGNHQAVGFYQSKFAVTRTYSAREMIQDPHTWLNAANYSSNAQGRISYKYYLGDNSGYNVDYAPPKSGTQTGLYTFHYLSNATTGAFTDEQALFGESPTGASRNRNELHTRGANLQSFLWSDRIVTTLGYRTDETRGRGTPGLVVNPTTGLFDFADLEKRGWNAWSYRAGDTKTGQVVLKPFLGWGFVDRRAQQGGFTGWAGSTLRSLSLFYNKSDSFQPDASPKKNLLGELLPDPNGQNVDRGFQIDLYKRKLSLRMNWYRTEQKDARVQGGASTAVGRTQQLDTGTSTFALYTWAQNVVVARPSMAGASAAQIQTETYKLMQLPDNWFDQFNGFATSDVNDVTSTGTEIELNFNPTSSFRLKFTAARQSTVDSNLSNANQDYIDLRLPAWLSIKDDAGNLWWTQTTANTWYNSFIIPTLKLARANLGKPRSQIKEWTGNLFGNYEFGDERWLGGLGEGFTSKLKGLGVGAAAHYADKSSIGFQGLVDPDGIARTYDITKPFYDPARISYDFNASYRLRLFNNKIRSRVQLNVRDAFSHQGSLRAISVNPDGTPSNFRIVDGPQWLLTTTFDF